MKDETIFVAGHKVSVYKAQKAIDIALPSVRRVIEEQVIAGKPSGVVHESAKTTASAVVATFLWMSEQPDT